MIWGKSNTPTLHEVFCVSVVQFLHSCIPVLQGFSFVFFISYRCKMLRNAALRGVSSARASLRPARSSVLRAPLLPQASAQRRRYAVAAEETNKGVVSVMQGSIA